MSNIQKHVTLWVVLFGLLLLPFEVLAEGKLLFRSRDTDLGYFFEVRDGGGGGDQLFITKGRIGRASKPAVEAEVHITAAFLSPDKRFLVVTQGSPAYGTVSEVFRFDSADGSIRPLLPEKEYRALLWKTFFKKQREPEKWSENRLWAGIFAVAENKAYVRMRGSYFVDEGAKTQKLYGEPTPIAIDLDTLSAEVVAEDALPKHWPRGRPTDSAQRYGSGFWVSPRCILTNRHVVGSAEWAIVANDHEECYADVVAVDKENDLALLEVGEKALTGTPLRFRKEDVPLGLGIRAYGFPLPEVQGFTVKVTAGTISGLYGLNDDPTSLQMTAAIQPGNSGGPVVDEKGTVVGVSVASLDKLKLAEVGVLPENANFCIHSEVAADFIRRHRPAVLNRTHEPIENVQDSVVQIVTHVGQAETITVPQQPEPAPSQPAVDSLNLEKAMSTFAASYLNSGNIGTAEQEASYYADRCDYFENGIQTNAQILADIKKYRNRWPQRVYTVKKLHGFETGKRSGTAAIVVDFDYAVANGSKRTSGIGSSLIVCEGVPERPRIIFVRSAVKKGKK